MGAGAAVTRPVILAGFALIALGALALELTARLAARRERSRALATFADALDTVVAHRLGRAAVLAAWLWLGWHLFVR
jgi:Flp pilus assembly protein TadB